MSVEREEINILLDQLEKQHKLTSVLTCGLVKVAIGILIMFTVVGIYTVYSYFWSPDAYSINNSNATQTDTKFNIGGDNNE